jgi:hypothetical protein
VVVSAFWAADCSVLGSSSHARQVMQPSTMRPSPIRPPW